MKRPVWTFELVRETNAPLEPLLERLQDGTTWGDWHPRHATAAPQGSQEGAGWTFQATWPQHLGLQEWETFQLQPGDQGVRLTYRARFKGWPVLLLMGWWRLRSEFLWERLVQSLARAHT